MKRILLICAAAVTVLSCAGCAEQNNPADISTPTEPLATQNGDVTQPTCVEHDCTTPAQTEAAVSTNEDTAPVVTTAEDTAEAATQSALETEAQTETVTTIKVPEQTEAQTDYVQGSYEMEKTAAKHMREMIAAAKEDGINLKVLSAYRTVNYQKKLFERNVKSRMEDYGMSYEEAYYDTSINIAPPGGSEHNAGLAADIITENDWDTYTGFEDTDEFAWLQIHAPEHGFILRYLKGKEDITGYIYEPWHYRYVGVKYAQDIMDSGLCLEEYFEKYVWVDGVEPSFPFDS